LNKKIDTKDFFESEDVLHALFDSSPIGILLVYPGATSKEWSTLQCNEAAWKTLGFEGKSELIQMPFVDLFDRPVNLDEIKSEVQEKGEAYRLVSLRNQEHDPFLAECYFKPVHLKGMDLFTISVLDTSYIKEIKNLYQQAQEGEEKFRSIFENSPDGIVIIDPTKGIDNWPIEDCNIKFVKMNGYDAREELVGQDILLVSQETAFKDPEVSNHRQKYYERLKQDTIRLEETHVRKDKSEFPIQASSCLITINGQERVLGIDRDISEEKTLLSDIDDLRKDVGRTFHSFTATLLQAQLAINATIRSLGNNPFEEGVLPPMEKVWNEIKTPLKSLTLSLGRLVDITNADYRKEALPESDWTELTKLMNFLLEIENIGMEQRVPILRRAARGIIDILDKAEKNKIRHDFLRETISCARQLEDIACLIALRQALDRMKDTDYLVRDLRERIVKGTRKIEDVAMVRFMTLVNVAIQDLMEYAQYKGVDLRVIDHTGEAMVNVGRKNITRAISNLLHNAIKYSWWRGISVSPYIEIRCYVRGERVWVEIEDYGVPIPREEIENELIYQLGYRGRLSAQLNRPGTGIGLADAREMARLYRGNVKLSSRAAPHEVNPDDLTVPHLKTATLWLPLYKK
jgi:PAS domain S-box-containing protein